MFAVANSVAQALAGEWCIGPFGRLYPFGTPGYFSVDDLLEKGLIFWVEETIPISVTVPMDLLKKHFSIQEIQERYTASLREAALSMPISFHEDLEKLECSMYEVDSELTALRNNFSRLLEIIENVFSPWTSSQWTQLFLENEKSFEAQEFGKTPGTVELLGFLEAPAAKGNHHATRGGLVVHLLEMWDLHKKFVGVLEAMQEDTSETLNDRDVLTVILAHDLHKGLGMFKVISREPWAVEYTSAPVARMVPKDVRSITTMAKYKIPLTDDIVNAIMNSEGGWAECKPKWSTVLAKYVYLLDEMSGNVLDRIRTGKILDAMMR